MKKFIYILFLLPLFSMGQIVPFGFLSDVACTVTADNVYLTGTADNAASECTNEGTNTGFLSGSVAAWSNITSSPDPYEGTYSLKVAKASGTSVYGQMAITGLTTSTSYTVTARIYMPAAHTGTAQILLQNVGGWTSDVYSSEVSTIGTDSWVDISATATTDATSVNVTIFQGGGTTIGDYVAVDKVRIVAN